MKCKQIIPDSAQKKAIFASIFIDTALFSLTIVLGYILHSMILGKPLLENQSFNAYFDVYWLPLLVAPAAFYLAGLYQKDPYRLLIRSLEKSFAGTCTAVVLVLIITYLFRGHLTGLDVLDKAGATTEKLRQLRWGFSFAVLLFTCLAAPVFIALWRFAANRLENRTVAWSNKPQNLLIAGHISASDINRLKHNYCPTYNIVGAITADGLEKEDYAVDILGGRENLPDILSACEVDEVMLSASQFSKDEIFNIIECSADYNVKVWIISDIYETILSAVTPSARRSVPLFEIRETRIAGWSLVIKRLMDIIIAFTALVVVVPLFIIPACILIVIDSKGFPLFKQKRVGLSGEVFSLYKIRTMVIDADQRGGVLTADNDPRITAAGRFLRKTSIDELPQLWNVLKGDMSLVGPRAVIPFVADRFEDWERISLNVKPGLTGLAQISGRDEVGFKEKSLLNLYYVRNFSLWLDLKIIFSTIMVVLSMEGTEGTRQNG
ncbi:MAG: sugar transferase [Planctomycetota bacterium]|jgi:exopolysaccharide biosynthesis polyprenyl glycosylphosphotransferase